MIEKSTTWQILEYFFICPTQEIHLRELSREVKISMPTLLLCLKKLEKESLVEIKRGKALTLVRACLENTLFIRLKRVFNLEQLYISGLVDYLKKEYQTPPALVCFGSYSRGDDTEHSDIDIAIIGVKESTISLEKFEKILHRTISLHFISLASVSKEFHANLANGIVLEGAL